MSCSSTQFMPLYPSGPSLYSWPSPSFHCFQFSLFSQSQPPLFFSHISDPSCLPIHLPLCQFLRPPKLNFPPLNPPTLFLSPLVTFMCWGPYFIRPPPRYVDKTAFSPIWVGHEEKIMHCSPSHPHLQQLPPAQPTAAEGTATGDAALQPARDSDALQGWSMHMRTLPGLEDGQWGRYPQEIWTLKRPTSFYLQFVQNADFTWLSKPGEIFRGVEKSHLSLIEKQPFPTVFWMSATKQREAWKLQH